MENPAFYPLSRRQVERRRCDRYPVIASAIREGFSASEKFFVNAGVSPARAVELAKIRVNEYRRSASAGRIRRNGCKPQTADQAKLHRDPAHAFSIEALTNVLFSEGVL